MPWSGGNYTLPTNISAWDVGGGKIDSSVFSSAHADIEGGIDNCLAKDGSNAATGNLPTGGNRHLNVGAAQSTNEYQRVGEAVNQWPIYKADGNVGSFTIDATLSVVPVLTPGLRIQTYAAGVSKPYTSEGSVHINLGNGVSAMAKLPSGELTIYPAAIRGNTPNDFVYNGTNFVLQNPAPVRWEHTISVTSDSGAYTSAASFKIQLYRQDLLCGIRMSANIGTISVSASVDDNIWFVPPLPSWARPKVIMYKYMRAKTVTSAGVTATIHGHMRLDVDGTISFKASATPLGGGGTIVNFNKHTHFGMFDYMMYDVST